MAGALILHIVEVYRLENTHTYIYIYFESKSRLEEPKSNRQWPSGMKLQLKASKGNKLQKNQNEKHEGCVGETYNIWTKQLFQCHLLLEFMPRYLFLLIM